MENQTDACSTDGWLYNPSRVLPRNIPSISYYYQVFLTTRQHFPFCQTGPISIPKSTKGTSDTGLVHTYPFLAPYFKNQNVRNQPLHIPNKSPNIPPKKRIPHTWKKNLTINTCSPAIHIIIILSNILKLNILLSVLLTVEKFLFSRVRKYF